MRKLLRKVKTAAIAVAVFLGLGLAWLWWGPGPADQAISVQIARGASLTSAARQLEAAGAVRDARRFYILARLLGSKDPIKAGEFALPASASPAQILDILQHNQPVQHLVTIPEGTPSILVYEKLIAEPLLTGTIDVPAEGSILPDSYAFERGETRAAVLARMERAMQSTLDALWAARKSSTVVKSPREAVTLASIVEKETGKPSERRMVAGVYSNRLRIGMKLDADPTVIYPITRGKPLGRRIRVSELRADNGYNTYARPGLPVGPIANPGRESLAAVLDPAPTRALFFVADGTGGHVFAETLAEHNQNVVKWRAIRRARGEM